MSHTDPFHDEPDWDALARFHAGESTPDEAASVRDWLAAHPADAALLEQVHGVVDARLSPPTPELTPDDVERALVRMHAAMDAAAVTSIDAARRNRPPAHPIRTLWWVTGAAAAAAAILVVSTRSASRVSQGTPTSAVASVTAGHAMTTGVGEREDVRLPDGTTVLLGPASRITIASAYGNGGREVSLDGVARFTVKHDMSAPFVVRAGTAVIRDIGTVFTVHAPAGATAHASVAVSEGAVSLGSERDTARSVTLGAGDRAELGADGRIVTQNGKASDTDVAWTRGVLAFGDASMDEVTDALRRWYGVTLSVDSTLTTRRLTATFEHQPVDEVLHAIALALGGTVTRDGTVATLRANAVPR